MTDTRAIAAHYGRSDLLDSILAGLASLGKRDDRFTVEDLAPVDEFHVGGREATRALLDQLAPRPGDRLLDLGCGIGGAARFAATEYGCDVLGVDLTADYVEAGNVLCTRTACDDRVQLVCRSATDTGLEPESCDHAYMLHVGMNIADKHALATEVFRVLKPGGRFGIYDLMRVGEGALGFPLPWATVPGHSALARPPQYREALEEAGFEVDRERNRRVFALDVARRMQAAMQRLEGPPPLGLHLLMGAGAQVKYANMVAAIESGIIAPVEIVARKPGRGEQSPRGVP